MEQQRFDITPEEIYQIIGELEVIRRKQQFQIQSLFKQVGEMSEEIDRLRKDGELVKPNSP